ncbi:hypothetical protein [Mucilaginibacter agri]|uniref:Uncharacterized protein n=1 Tax=Mucilaginibacter agri TaxID=2695265 RepID=A0A965ZH09_9SPHI|nr:hypothetical protein [Mucilaginibacter agri]NCD70845.1 hypothetical protein [Mucilaginibacter agri]
MRKLVAIILLSVHLFNLYGYNMLNRYFAYRTDVVMNEHIAKNMYNVHSLVMVKLPVSLPNIQNWNSFERISGQINFKNASYNYVKMKLTKDTIYVMCVPNYKATRLSNENIICARQLDDLPGAKNNNMLLKKPTMDKFSLPMLVFKAENRVSPVTKYFVTTKVNPKGRFKETPYQPPDILC